MVHPSWLDNISREEIELYLDFVKELSPRERRIFVYSEILGKTSGEIGKVFETKDVKDKWIGVCGSDARIYVPRSNSIQGKVDGIEARLRRKIEARFPYIGTHIDGKRKEMQRGDHPKRIELDRSRYLHAIETGFNGLIQDILFHDKGEHKLNGSRKEELDSHYKEGRYRAQQTALLFLNIPRLDQSVKRWLAEKRSLVPSYRIA